MISQINSIYFMPANYKFGRMNNKNNFVQSPVIHNSMPQDSVCFTGKSAPSVYSSVFEYLAAEIMGRNKKLQVDGSMLSATKIGGALNDLFENNMVFTPFKKTIVDKIKWKSYIPMDIREGSVAKINENG